MGYFQKVMENSFPDMDGKLTVFDATRLNRPFGFYPENNIAFYAVMDGVDDNLPLCQVIDGFTDCITGYNIEFQSQVVREYGINRYWDVIPMEFLFATAETKPARITVDGAPTICPR